MTTVNHKHRDIKTLVNLLYFKARWKIVLFLCVYIFQLKMKNCFPPISKHLTVFLLHPNNLDLSLRKMHHPTGRGMFPRHANLPAEAIPSAKLWDSQSLKAELDVVHSYSPVAHGSFLQGKMSENGVPAAAHPSLFTPNIWYVRGQIRDLPLLLKWVS